MSFAATLTPGHARGAEHPLRSFSPRFHARSHSDGGRRRIPSRFRGDDSFVRQSSAARSSQQTQSLAVIAEPGSLRASSAESSFRTSSRTVVREDNASGTTTTVQRDRADFRLRSAQIGLESGDVAGVASALEGQVDALQRVFEAAGLLGDFSTDLANEFLARIRSGLETDSAGQRVQASTLDLNIRVRSKTIRVESENGSIIERSIQRIDIRVRFVALSLSGEVAKPSEPLQADIEHGAGRLQGLGTLQQFDFNGDGQFTFDDIAALADEVVAG